LIAKISIFSAELCSSAELTVGSARRRVLYCSAQATRWRRRRTSETACRALRLMKLVKPGALSERNHAKRRIPTTKSTTPLLKISLCGGGVPSSHRSLGLSVLFLSVVKFFLSKKEEEREEVNYNKPTASAGLRHITHGLKVCGHSNARHMLHLASAMSILHTLSSHL